LLAGLLACSQGQEPQTAVLSDRLSAADGGNLEACSDDEAIGRGDYNHPVAGPAPVEAARVGGSAFVLVKNWDFGTNGTVRDIPALSREFVYHDQFGTIANGTNYGAVTVAASADTAVYGYHLNLPNNLQPVDTPERPFRALTAESLMTYVRPLDATSPHVSAAEHNVGSGSFMAKWNLPGAGAPIGRDLLWETRVRIPKPVQGYWFALWACGSIWDNGPEIDVVESYGSPYVVHDAFHSLAVGGSNQRDYTLWPTGLDASGVPADGRDLREWHTWTMLIQRDNSFRVFFDGHVVQEGRIYWRVGGDVHGETTNLHFLFDFGWGHTGLAAVNIALWAAQFPIEYEVDYSRVYLR
jgi:hypothetical protein